MKRNTLFGAVALLVAGAAIGAGSVVTQSAMADSTPTDPAADTVTVGQIGSDGKGFQCTFTGADAAALMPSPAEMTAVAAGQPVEITGSFEVDPSNPGAGVQIAASVPGASGAAGDSGVISVSAGDSSGVEPVPADLVTAQALPEGAVDVTDIRQGTPDECTGLLKDLPKP